MAKMIDKKPSWKGEGKVWESLSTNLPGDNVVYNQREVNGREYDFCVLAENLGLVIIEVKGWDSDKIDVRGVDNIIVEGYDEPQTSPKKQARAYRFAILNKIVEKYNVSPLVLDMVCYPFITQEQYIKTKLDIVSEPEYTIFKEDIEDGEKLNEKIQHLFTRNKFIPHADFSSDLLVRIRKQLEPEFELSVVDDQNKPYSKISIFPNDINENIIQTIIGDYFDGVKQIVFVREQTDFALFLEFLNDSFKLHNIDFKKNNLKVGYEDGIKVSKYKDVFSTFNISIYCIQNLQTIISEELVVVDGQCDEKQHELLATLSNITSFNVQQYDIEHATTDRDILVEAGAGTGKTYSMVSRIAFLCNKQDEPVMNIADEVAMVTFTNDAAINMKKRLKQMFVNYFVLTGYERYLKYVEDIDRANISTIHKFAINILRGESLYTGLGTNFKISSNEYERGKAYDLFLSEFLEKKEEENTNFSNELPIPVYDLKKKLMNIADRLFDKSINLETIKSSEMGTVVENNIPFLNDLLLEVMFPAEAIYTETMRNSNDIDLRECLIELEKILSNGCEKLEDLKIRYLFIDEFQDTDDVQIEVFQKLQKSINTKCRLFVVGDLKQSIYRFRGAKLNAFQKLQNGKKVDWCHYRLNRNYRTDGRLLELFDSVFSGMGAEGILPYKPGEDQLLSDVLTDRNENDLFTELPCHGKDNDKILDLLNDTILEEKSKIEEMCKEKELSKEERTIAILVRSNWQVDNIVSAASKKDINIEISTGGDLFQLPSTLDLYKLVLAKWIMTGLEEGRLKVETDIKPLLSSFFSSSWAFEEHIKKCGFEEIDDKIENWIESEQYNIDHIVEILEDPDAYYECYASRLVVVLNALFDEYYDKKVVLFTNYEETFEAYKSALSKAFSEEEVSFFGANMSIEEVELNAYRFQSQEECRILLCDYTGGEGRNFQCADYIVHIDLPWDASAIEQRIGRLDRLERDMSRPMVYSVVVHTINTFEDALFKFFKDGLQIFNQSLSGMEIIMRDINNEIVSAISSDFKYGLLERIPVIIELAYKMRRDIRKEQNFDAAGFIYRPMYTELRRLIEYYAENENELFATTMLNWASLAGFHGHKNKKGEITYSATSFVAKSAINSQLIPPKWNDYLNTNQNKFLLQVQEAFDKKMARRSMERSIKGTFSRKLAIENDYLHFFAPGDEIFDCIVDNAINSCKGCCSAFAVKSNITWTGLIFTWAIEPNNV